MLDAEWHIATEFTKAFSTPLLVAIVEMGRRTLIRLRSIEEKLTVQNGRLGKLETRMTAQERLCDHMLPPMMHPPR